MARRPGPTTRSPSDARARQLSLTAEGRRVYAVMDAASSTQVAHWLDALSESEQSRLLAAMRVDKKARADRLRFVVLDGLAKPRLLEDPDPSHLVAAWHEVRREKSGTIGV